MLPRGISRLCWKPRTNGYHSTVQQPQPFQLSKLFAVVGVSIVAGSVAAVKFTEFLERNQIYKYVPEEEEKEEDSTSDSSVDQARVKLLGDHRLNIGFMWNLTDADSVALMKTRLTEELEDFDDSVSNQEIENKLDAKQIELTRRYLRDMIALYAEKERGLKQT